MVADVDEHILLMDQHCGGWRAFFVQKRDSDEMIVTKQTSYIYNELLLNYEAADIRCHEIESPPQQNIPPIE